jgi:hypothetical protein
MVGARRGARAIAGVAAAALVLAAVGCTTEPTRNVGARSGEAGATEDVSTSTGSTSDVPPWGSEWTEEQRRIDRPVEMSPVALRMPFAPTPFEATDDKVHLTFEVEITNVTAAVLTIDEVTVSEADAPGAPIKTYAAAEIKDSMARAGAYFAELDALDPGQTGIFFVDLALDSEADVPDALVATVAVTADLTTLPPEMPAHVATPETSVAVPVDRTPVPVIGPPLAGNGWTAFEGCCQRRTHHRFASYALDGNLVVFERYAIDFVQLGEDGQAWSGDETAQNYVGYGADLLAVADATVVIAVDGEEDNEIGEPQPDRTFGESMGNHVVLDLGNDVYAMYAHIPPGAVKVKAGDKVTKGQVIGQLGNSGQSTNPHLHFHLVDNPTGALGQGVPFVFDSLAVVGSAEIVGGEPFEVELDALAAPEPRTDQYPLTQTVVDFAPAG